LRDVPNRERHEGQARSWIRGHHRAHRGASPTYGVAARPATGPVMKIPVAQPCFDQAEEEAVIEVLRSRWVSQGARVARFEAALAEYQEAKYAVATTSCTTGLHLVLAALGIGQGDEVLIPAFTFVAPASAVEYQRATPVF